MLSELCTCPQQSDPRETKPGNFQSTQQNKSSAGGKKKRKSQDQTSQIRDRVKGGKIAAHAPFSLENAKVCRSSQGIVHLAGTPYVHRAYQGMKHLCPANIQSRKTGWLPKGPTAEGRSVSPGHR